MGSEENKNVEQKNVFVNILKIIGTIRRQYSETYK